jgi:outer membrane protein assembly factor BamA
VKKRIKTFFILLAVMVAAACNPARRLSNDQYLLNENKIVVDNPSVDKEDLEALYKQKPNRKIFGLFRFHLWIYNLVDKEKAARDREAKNEIRRAKGKPEKTLIGREKLQNIGEEPAILDSSLTERTRRQFQLYLFRKGFYHATVTDTVVYKKNKQANVTYILHCNQPYMVRNISYSSRDSAINQILISEQPNSLIKKGSKYDEDILESERERITSILRDRGYYYFNKNYITYDPDSSLGSHEVDVYFYLNRINENVDQSLNMNLTTEDHHTYTLNNIYIQTDFNPKEPNAVPIDTVMLNDFYFLSTDHEEEFRKEPILRTIFFKKGDLFKQTDLDYTYTRLLNLSVFKFIKVLFTEVPRDSSHQKYLLNVNIQLTPVPKQDYTIEMEATHAGSNLGMAGSIGYRNKNSFKGAEFLEFKIKGGVEALRNFNDSLNTKKLFFFNTYEIGPEINMNVKRFVPAFAFKGTSRRSNPRTNFSASFNLQSRPDFTRRILNFSAGWIWTSPSGRQIYNAYPIDLNSVNVSLSNEFHAKLDSSHDLNLINSYSTHLTPGGRFTWITTNQSLHPFRSFIYFRANVEWAGLLVAPTANGFLSTPVATDGTKTLFNVGYAQYFKPDIDFSFHQRLNLHNTIVYRFATGLGIEGPNSAFLPFEKSFFAGGAYSLRAWLARTLGPGSYKNILNIEQPGDMKIESNIELRSSLIKILEGALFVDAGNIWTRHEDIHRPGAHFVWKNMFDEMALGAGAGVRLNFSFFILRVDFAVKLHDPSLDPDERWVYSHQKFQPKDVTLNLAIGYPF